MGPPLPGGGQGVTSLASSNVRCRAFTFSKMLNVAGTFMVKCFCPLNYFVNKHSMDELSRVVRKIEEKYRVEFDVHDASA